MVLALSAAATGAASPGGGGPRDPAAAPAPADPRDRSLGPHLVYVEVESEALKGNLVGDPHVREMAVLLPPHYFEDEGARFPVVYLLHGLGRRRDGHLASVHLQKAMFEQMKAGRLVESIIVAVDGSTTFGGSYFANSRTIGNFEWYVAREIVSRVDDGFRTQAHRSRRAIAGFSMGGHGAIKLAMKYPDVFSQVGSLSGSPLSMRYRKAIYRNSIAGRMTRPQTLEELVTQVSYETNWTLAAAYAKAAAFSPNPRKPPLFLDMPFEKPEGEDEEDPVWQAWLSEDPLALVTRYQRNLKRLDTIYLDHGDSETTLGTEDFDRELVRYGIGHEHHVFRGDHVDHLPRRCFRMFRAFADEWEVP